jgi:hypothetical protein
LYDVLPLVVDVSGRLTFHELVRSVATTLQEAINSPVPGTMARGMLAGPIDVTLNYFQDRREPSVSVGPHGTLIGDYRPCHRRFASFPTWGLWQDSHLFLNTAAQQDGHVLCSVGYDPRAASSAMAITFGRGVAEFTRAAAISPGARISTLAPATVLRSRSCSC